MTNCTPAHARALADMMRSAGPLTRTNVVDALLSLADQVDGLTAENANILRASLYSADLATQAMEDVKTLTAERDALKATALKFNWVLEALTEPPECKKELLLFAAIDRLDLQGLTSVELVAYLDTAITDAMKEPK